MTILWPGQRNGQISLSLMSLIIGYRMHPAAAVSFLAMRAALFAATGVWLGISDAYRSFAEQDRVFRDRYTSGWSSGIWYAGQYWRKRAGVPVAAVPGTSNHGWALALDINNYGATNGRVFRWLLDHAAAFGWSWTTGRNVNEPWHWEYVGSLIRPASGGIIIITPEKEEDDMAKTAGFSYIRKTDNKTVCGMTNPASGYFTEWEAGDGAYNSAVAATFDTGTFAPITQSHRDALERAAAQVRTGK